MDHAFLFFYYRSYSQQVDKAKFKSIGVIGADLLFEVET